MKQTCRERQNDISMLTVFLSYSPMMAYTPFENCEQTGTERTLKSLIIHRLVYHVTHYSNSNQLGCSVSFPTAKLKLHTISQEFLHTCLFPHAVHITTVSYMYKDVEDSLDDLSKGLDVCVEQAASILTGTHP